MKNYLWIILALYVCNSEAFQVRGNDATPSAEEIEANGEVTQDEEEGSRNARQEFKFRGSYDLPCLSCGLNGHNYYWCRATTGDWDYCSPQRGLDYRGLRCHDACSSGDKKYQWCHSGDNWGYCST